MYNYHKGYNASDNESLEWCHQVYEVTKKEYLLPD